MTAWSCARRPLSAWMCCWSAAKTASIWGSSSHTWSRACRYLPCPFHASAGRLACMHANTSQACTPTRLQMSLGLLNFSEGSQSLQASWRASRLCCAVLCCTVENHSFSNLVEWSFTLYPELVKLPAHLMCTFPATPDRFGDPLHQMYSIAAVRGL